MSYSLILRVLCSYYCGIFRVQPGADTAAHSYSVQKKRKKAVQRTCTYFGSSTCISSAIAREAARAIHTVANTAIIVTIIAYERVAGILVAVPNTSVKIAVMAACQARAAINAKAVVTRVAITFIYSALPTMCFASDNLVTLY